jgi:hypothetical protein
MPGCLWATLGYGLRSRENRYGKQSRSARPTGSQST